MKTEKIIIDGVEQEVYIVSEEEIENNNDLINLEDTLDLSEVVIDE